MIKWLSISVALAFLLSLSNVVHCKPTDGSNSSDDESLWPADKMDDDDSGARQLSSIETFLNERYKEINADHQYGAGSQEAYSGSAPDQVTDSFATSNNISERTKGRNLNRLYQPVQQNNPDNSVSNKQYGQVGRQPAQAQTNYASGGQRPPVAWHRHKGYFTRYGTAPKRPQVYRTKASGYNQGPASKPNVDYPAHRLDASAYAVPPPPPNYTNDYVLRDPAGQVYSMSSPAHYESDSNLDQYEPAPVDYSSFIKEFYAQDNQPLPGTKKLSKAALKKRPKNPNWRKSTTKPYTTTTTESPTTVVYESTTEPPTTTVVYESTTETPTTTVVYSTTELPTTTTTTEPPSFKEEAVDKLKMVMDKKSKEVQELDSKFGGHKEDVVDEVIDAVHDGKKDIVDEVSNVVQGGKNKLHELMGESHDAGLEKAFAHQDFPETESQIEDSKRSGGGPSAKSSSNDSSKTKSSAHGAGLASLDTPILVEAAASGARASGGVKMRATGGKAFSNMVAPTARHQPPVTKAELVADPARLAGEKLINEMS